MFSQQQQDNAPSYANTLGKTIRNFPYGANNHQQISPAQRSAIHASSKPTTPSSTQKPPTTSPDNKLDLQQQVESWTRKYKKLTQTVEQLVEEKVLLQNQIMEYKETTQNLQQNLAQAQKDVANAQQQVSSKEQELVTVKKQALEAASSSNDTDLFIARQHLEQCQHKEREWNELQEELLHAVRDAQHDAHKCQQELHQIAQEHGTCTQEAERKELFIQSLQLQQKQEREQAQQEKQQNLTMREQLEQSLQQTKLEMEHLQQEWSKKETQWQLKQQEMSQKLYLDQQSIQHYQELMKGIEKEHAAFLGLQNDYAKTKQALEREQSSAQQLRNQLEQIVKNAEQDKAQSVTVQKEKQDTWQQLQTASNQLTVMQQQLAKLQQEHDMLLKEKTIERKVLHEEIHDLRQEKSTMENDFMQEKQAKEKLERELDSLVSKYANMERENQVQQTKLEQRIAILEKQLEKYGDDNKQLQDTKYQLQMTISQRDVQITQLQDVVTAHEQDKKKANILLQQSMQKAQSMENELTNNMASQHYHKQQHTDLQELHEQYKSSTQLEMNSLLNIIKRLKADSERKTKKIEDLECGDMLHSQMAKERDAFKKDLESAHQAIAILRQTNRALEERIRKSNDVIKK